MTKVGYTPRRYSLIAIVRRRLEHAKKVTGGRSRDGLWERITGNRHRPTHGHVMAAHQGPSGKELTLYVAARTGRTDFCSSHWEWVHRRLVDSPAV